MIFVIIGIVFSVIVIVFTFFLKAADKEMKNLMDSDIGRAMVKRSQQDHLRQKIAQSHCVEEQKRLAAQASSKSPLKLKGLGEIVGVIFQGFFVLKNAKDELQVICSACVKKSLDESYSSEQLPPHQQGGATVKGLSSKDYAQMKLFTLSLSQRVMQVRECWSRKTISGKGIVLDTVHVPFEGKIPSCEMSCCK
jgi:hypothetical protein